MPTYAFTIYVPMLGIGFECIVLDFSGEIGRMFFVHDGQLVVCDGLLQLFGSFSRLRCRRMVIVVYGLVSRDVGVTRFIGFFQLGQKGFLGLVDFVSFRFCELPVCFCVLVSLLQWVDERMNDG